MRRSLDVRTICSGLVSRMPSERIPKAGEVKERVVDEDQMFMTNQQAAKLPEPRIGSFYDPSTLVSTESATVLIAPPLVVFSVRRIKSMARFLNRSRSGSES
jgi:hypothetical protein